MGKVRKSLLVGATVATVTLGGAGGIGLVSAATDNSSSSGSSSSTSSTDKGGMSGLIDKIATKFNLNKDEVKAVFDQDRTDRMAEHKAEQKQKLAQAVTDGKLTQAQADYITKALEEIETLRGSTTPENESSTTRDQIKSKMDALRTWAKDNSVDMQYVMGGHGGPGGRGPGGRMGGSSQNATPDDGSAPSESSSDSSSSSSSDSSSSSSSSSN